MPKGKGTYGKQVGRPPKKMKKAKKKKQEVKMKNCANIKLMFWVSDIRA